MRTPSLPPRARLLRGVAAALCIAAIPYAAATDISTVPLPTYSVGGSVDIKPNILMVLDDSGSMASDYMPDWANDIPPNHSSIPNSLYKNAAFNGLAYNPAVTYSPPVTFTSTGAKSTSTYPSMSGTSAATGANTGVALPNWRAVKNDGFSVQDVSGTSNLQSTTANRNQFWTTIPGEYCDSPALTNCTTTTTATGNFQYPAPLRWCSDAQLTTCRALQSSTYDYPRIAAQKVATITLTSAGSAVVTGITVDGVQIMSASTASSSTNSTVAQNVVNQINACTYALPTTTNCQTVGYSAYLTGGSSNVVYILSPGTTTSTPSLSKSGTLNVAYTSFANQVVPLVPWQSGTTSTAAVPGNTLVTTVYSGNNSYPYPGTAAKAPTRTDCSGSTCTFVEEMTNYANWWAYYRTRMQMMKTSTARAFSALDSDADVTAGTTRYRVGYMSINNNTSNDFVNITDFTGTQKFAWYSRLLAASPANSTPLRQALSQAGRIYAGKYNGATFNGSTVVDPLQYSCQKNFTILSTDGYWNGNGGVKLDGTTAIGNEDGLLNRPYSDGTAVQVQQKTSQLQSKTNTQSAQKGTLQAQVTLTQKRTATLQKLESQLQSQSATLEKLESQLQAQSATLNKLESQLQSQTSTLNKLESQLQSRTSTLQTRTSTLQTQTYQLQSQTNLIQLRNGTASSASSNPGGYTRQSRTSSNSGATFGPWGNVGSCTVDNSGTTRTECRWVLWTGGGTFTNAGGSCTEIIAGSGAVRECQYAGFGAFTNAPGSCTVVPQATSGTYTDAVNCQYTAGSGLVNATAACTPVAKSTGPTNYTVNLARDCTYTAFTAFANATAACTPATQNNTNLVARDCQYTAYTTYANAASCTFAAQTASAPFTQLVATDCQYVDTTGSFVSAGGSCAVVDKSTGPNYTVALARQCQYSAYTAFANASTCTAAAQSTGPVNYTVGTAVNCQYVDTTASFVSSGASCTAVAKSTGPNYTVALARQCQYTAYGAYANAASCTAAAQGTGPVFNTAVNCQYVDTTAAFVSSGASCTAVAKSTGPSYTVALARQCQYTAYSAFANASTCTAAAQSSGPNYATAVNCQYVDTTTAPVNTASCQPVSKSAGPSYTVALSRACSYTAYTAFAPSNGVCTIVNQSSGTGNWTTATAVDCQSSINSPFADSASCSVTTTNSSGLSTQCQYSFAASAPTSTCTPAYVANNYTNATVYQNCGTTSTAFTNVSSCTATTVPDAAGQTTSCQYTAYTAWSNTPACVAAAQSTGPNYTVGLATQCQTLTSGGNSNTLADVAAYYYYNDLRNASATGANATGTCVGPTIAPATTPNDLCTDNVPTYGRDTNIKQHMTTHTLGLGVQGEMVFSQYQNNVAGQRVYIPDYWNQPSGDFYAVANGSTANSATGICPWLSNGTSCTWSTPSADAIANIDDLWHAAINGHGTYFSATDPSSLADALKNVLSQITNVPRPGTAAAAASSNPNITSSDNFVFSSSYKSVDWYGELIMQRFNSDGSLTDQQWSAMRLLDCAASAWAANTTYYAGQTFQQGGACYVVGADYTSGATFGILDTASATAITGVTPFARTVYTVGAANTLIDFSWAALSATQQSYFQQPYIDALTQFCTVGAACLSATAKTAAAGSALVSFLRGDRSNESTYFRSRKHVLGDIVSSEARYVKTPLQNYADTNYSAYKTLHANRASSVYVGSNDGMLHSFDASTGAERWAFVPSAMLPQIYKLADSDYANRHQFFVDGSPEVGDICPNAPGSACSAAQWRTILVGGFNDGAQAYYALDITDPTSPTLLWEFDNSASKANGGLGYSYSNPRITKLRDGTWVVMVASGYNNTDGIGRLYVLNAATGALIRTIATGAGTAAVPSGLAKLSARATTGSTNNTAEQVYGGDLLGNVWRFDVNDNVGPAGYEAFKLVQLVDGAGLVQPITAKPTVAAVNGFPLVMVGTGRYLGLSDLTETGTYTMYAIKDSLGTTTLGNPRTGTTGFVQQVMTDTTCPTDAPATICTSGQTVRTSTSNAVDWSVKNGWYVDFIVAGERSVTDPTLALGTLVFTTLKPQTSTSGSVIGCTADNTSINAKSYLYYINYLTGGAVDGTKSVSGEELCTCYATRPSVVKDEQGNVEGIIRTSGGGVSTGTDMGVTNRQNLPYSAGGNSTRRISWRQLNGE